MLSLCLATYQVIYDYLLILLTQDPMRELCELHIAPDPKSSLREVAILSSF